MMVFRRATTIKKIPASSLFFLYSDFTVIIPIKQRKQMELQLLLFRCSVQNVFSGRLFSGIFYSISHYARKEISTNLFLIAKVGIPRF